MLKNFLLSFLSLDIYKYLVLPTGVIFVVVILYVKNPTPLLRTILIVMTIILACALIYYYFKKFQMRKKIRTIENPSEYNTAVMLGHNFLLDDRMLVYQNRDIFEEKYENLVSVDKEVGKKDTINLRCHFQNHECVIPTGSELQAQRTVAFFQKQNSQVTLNGIEPTGDGLLHTIDQVKV